MARDVMSVRLHLPQIRVLGRARRDCPLRWATATARRALQHGLLGGSDGCGCDGGRAGSQVGPGGDEAVVGAGF